MKSPETLTAVAEFHKTFGQPVLETPQIPSEARCALRVSLISEELEELREGIRNNDIIEIADALADLQYVLTGTILEFGLGNRFKEIFDEVQKSNMSKACENAREAMKTMLHYELKGVESYSIKEGERTLVKRSSDDKVLKSVNYSPADIKSILEKEVSNG